MGVQFSPPLGYQQVRIGEVWSLYKAHYPTVQEQPFIPPTFETFGPAQLYPFGPGLNIVSGALHDRFWFINSTGDELIQFQNDRILHNWRKVGERKNEYPRFERMIGKFADELRAFDKYAASLAPQSLVINQCEISYINHFEVDPGPIDLSKWLKRFDLGGQKFDDVNVVLRQVLYGEGQRPIGRIMYEVATAHRPNGQRILMLTLTVRGAPTGSKVDDALKFIAMGREAIVLHFDEITTPEAHALWQRQN